MKWYKIIEFITLQNYILKVHFDGIQKPSRNFEIFLATCNENFSTNDQIRTIWILHEKSYNNQVKIVHQRETNQIFDGLVYLLIYSN